MPQRILVVDDEAHIVQVLSLKLRNAGYEVITAVDGEEAFELASKQPPDLVITDFQMPYMTGLELCRAMRDQPSTSNVPVLMLTARGYALDEADLTIGNIRDVLSKPFSPRSILQQIETILKPSGGGWQCSNLSVGGRLIQPETNLETALNVTALRNRLRDVGMVLVTCNEQGEMTCAAPSREDWLAALLTSSPMTRAGLGEAAARWSCQVDPLSIEIMPGVWALAMPIMSRRKRIGYSVALLPGQALLESEYLPAMCQPARLDFLLTRTLLAQLPPALNADMGRLAALVRYLHEDHVRLNVETQAAESVGRQLAESYEEMNLLYTIIQSMTVQQRPERFVAIACEELLATLPYAWIGTQLADDTDRLKSLSGRLIVAGQPGQPAGNLRAIARQLFAEAQPGAAIVLETATNPRHAQYATLGKTVVIQPVTSSGMVIGLLIAGEKKGSDTSASSVDMKLLGATATHMAIFLENAALYDDLNAMFLGTLEALTASIDAKDRYTCGHSRRVAHLTQRLAEAVGLDEYAVRRMHIAGLVHDVGKIGVPEAVLLKPGKLTEEEFKWIRRHPEMGYRILKDIPQLQDILPGVLYHHERWDGRGYPDGLAGSAIPIAARLIGLADSFDAMSSTRTYRSALTRNEVLDEILKCTGKQFDPELAPLFVKLDFREFDRMVADHRAAGPDVSHQPLRQQRGEAA